MVYSSPFLTEKLVLPMGIEPEVAPILRAYKGVNLIA